MKEGLKVIVADDDPDATRVICDILKIKFILYETTPLDNAVGIIEEFEPHIVVVGIGQHQEDIGLELVRKTREKHPQTSTIITVKESNDEFIAAAIQIGAFDIVSKPLNINYLAHKIDMATRIVTAKMAQVAVELQLEQQKQILAEVQKAVSVGSWKWSPTHNSIIISKEMAAIFGVSDQTSYGDLREILETRVHPKDSADILYAMTKIKNYHNIESLEFRIIHPDRGIRWIKASTPQTLTTANKSSPSTILGLVQDITEHKVLEEANERYLVDLDRKNITISEIIAQVTREKDSIQEDIALNIEEGIKPLLFQLKETTPDVGGRIEVIERELDNLFKDFYKCMGRGNYNLTKTELKIAKLVKMGYSEKEISSIQRISLSTVKKHKLSIRRKLDLSKKPMDLKVYLDQIK